MSTGNRRAARASRYLEKIGSKLGLTKEGADWLTLAIDPFNDALDTCAGYPDGTGTKCIVEPIKETFTINAPPSIGSLNWDCHITMLPWLLPITCGNSCQQYTTNFYAPGANEASLMINAWNVNVVPGDTQKALGGLMIQSQPSTFDNWNPFNTWSSGNYMLQNVFPSPDVATGNFRVIGAAFEVCNTTADLYKQGSCTIYRTPVASTQTANSGSIYISTTSVQYPATVLNIDSWPVTSQAAFIAIDSVQHAAADGCYVVSSFNQSELPYCKFNSTQPFVVMGNPDGTEPNEVSAYNLMPTPYGGDNPGVTAAYGALGVQWTNMHMSGALFTGLSPGTTLQVNVKWIIEKFPSQNDSVLAPISHNSPDRDHVALEMYSHLVDNMPVGCKFDDNGFGDWISDALSTVADYVAPVLSAIPHPLAQAAGAAINVARHVAKQPVKMATPHPSMSYVEPVNAVAVHKKIKNSEVKKRNAEIRAKNELIRARKLAKAKKKS